MYFTAPSVERIGAAALWNQITAAMKPVATLKPYPLSGEAKAVNEPALLGVSQVHPESRVGFQVVVQPFLPTVSNGYLV